MDGGAWWATVRGVAKSRTRLSNFTRWWFDLRAVQGTLKSLLQQQFKSINSLVLSLLYGPAPTYVCDYWKNYQFSSVQSLIHVLLFATP